MAYSHLIEGKSSLFPAEQISSSSWNIQAGRTDLAPFQWYSTSSLCAVIFVFSNGKKVWLLFADYISCFLGPAIAVQKN